MRPGIIGLAGKVAVAVVNLIFHKRCSEHQSNRLFVGAVCVTAPVVTAPVTAP
jgi:hypothetical protein